MPLRPSSRRPRSSRRSLWLALAVTAAVVIPGATLFTAVSQAATLPLAAMATTFIPNTSNDVITTNTSRPPTTSPPPCPTTNTPGFTPRPSGDPVPPTPPCRLTARVHTGNQLSLTWGASYDNIGVTAYVLYDRANGVTVTREMSGQTTGIELGGAPPEQHTYWVVAKDAIGNVSGPSNIVTVGGGTVIATVDSLPPTAPTNLTVSIANGQATLNWTASADNVSVTEYVVNDMYTDVVELRRLPGTQTTLTIYTSAPGIQHTWWVVARDVAGNTSPSSNRVQIGTPPTCPPPGQCQTPTTPTTRSTTPTAQPVTCRITYAIQSQWPGYFQASVTIANTGTTPINGWALDFTFPNGQTISNLWSGVASGPGPALTVRNASFNASIPVNSSVWFGFNARQSGVNQPPTQFTLNGQPCSIA